MYILPSVMKKAVDAAKTMPPGVTVVEISVGRAHMYISRDKKFVDMIFTRFVLDANPNDEFYLAARKVS